MAQSSKTGYSSMQSVQLITIKQELEMVIGAAVEKKKVLQRKKLEKNPVDFLFKATFKTCFS